MSTDKFSFNSPAKTLLCALALLPPSINAACTYSHGVTLCDDGDSILERFDGVYTLTGSELRIERYTDCGFPFYKYQGHHYSEYYEEGYYSLYPEYSVQRIRSEQQTNAKPIPNQQIQD